VVETRRLHVWLRPTQPVRAPAGFRDVVVRDVREHALVHGQVVGHLPVRLDPGVLVGRLDLGPERVDRVDRALLEGALGVEVRGEARWRVSPLRLEPLAHGGQVLGRSHLGYGELMLHSLLFGVERNFHREDRTSVLDRAHPPRGEAPAVADPIDVVDDGYVRVPGPQKISVQ